MEYNFSVEAASGEICQGLLRWNLARMYGSKQPLSMHLEGNSWVSTKTVRCQHYHRHQMFDFIVIVA
jgi:hypothetical protein